MRLPKSAGLHQEDARGGRAGKKEPGSESKSTTDAVRGRGVCSEARRGLTPGSASCADDAKASSDLVVTREVANEFLTLLTKTGELNWKMNQFSTLLFECARYFMACCCLLLSSGC